ncbi:DEAD-box ATP-dependent RNA helicase 26, partial [Durusdinium trenchii]
MRGAAVRAGARMSRRGRSAAPGEGWRPILWEQRFARSHALSQGREKIRLNESGEERTSVPERFSELPISEETQRALHEVFGYHEMSKVQAQVIPEALAKNQDLVVRAHTGTGKTLAFLIPAVEKLLHTPTHGVAMLVISPTRELALQIHREAETLLSHHEISSLSMIGGTNQRQDQVSLRRRKPRVLIATPGRLLEHLERTYLFPTLFENLQTLVLDEADRLLSLGFLPEVKEIVSYLPSRRRTMLFSATMPETVMDVISKACRGNYRYIDCVGEETTSQTALMAQQSYVVLPGHQCLAALYNLIINEMASDRYGYKILVFFATARMTSFMAQFFRQQLHLGVFEIHRRRE